MDRQIESSRPATIRPTLKTIALETGLAVATVSRALKNASDIGEETKRRVKEAAKRLGYRPNRAGVRLRTGKTNVIALVFSTEADVMNHASQLIYSAAEALRGTAYHIVIMPFFADEDAMAPIEYIVETESADGMVLNQTMPDDPRVKYLAERNFPFATHGRTELGLDHPYFDYDNEAFAELAVQELVRRGRKKLMIVAPPRNQTYSAHMIAGFTKACDALGVSAEVLDTVHSDSGAKRIHAAIAERFQQPGRPDGILAGSTTAAMAVVTGAESLGLAISTDFDLAAKEALNFLVRFRPGIIVLHEDVGKAGHFLAAALMSVIENNDNVPRQHLDHPTIADLVTSGA
ncbi:MAG: LacI family transcriptional regulator [Microgenomates group bacterium]